MNLSKILIVGSGSAGRRHFNYARKYFSECEIALLSQHSQPIFNDKHYTSIDSAREFDADLIVIANAAIDHMKTFSQLGKSKKLYLIEKPISSGINEIALSKIDVQADYENVMIAYQLRYSQSLLALKSELDSERFGKILSVRIQIGQYLPDWRKTSDYRESVSARSELGGGVINELSHEIDLLIWLFGEPKLIFSHYSKRSALDIDVEDFAEFITYHSKEGDQHKWSAHVTLDMFRRDPVRVCEVIGESGTLLWDGIEGSLRYFDSYNGKWRTLVVDSTNPHELLWNDVKDFAKTGKHKGATFQDGIAVLNFIHLLKESNLHFVVPIP